MLHFELPRKANAISLTKSGECLDPDAGYGVDLDSCVHAAGGWSCHLPPTVIKGTVVAVLVQRGAKMRVHHLDGGGTRPPGGRLVDGRPGVFRPAHMVAHCLLIEHSDGLLLVDTGYGERAAKEPDLWVGRRLIKQTNPVLDRPIARQVEDLGYSRRDVRDIIVTHLDLDHAGGLVDFPWATVHVHRDELTAISGPLGRRDRFRYRPVQLAHEPRWSIYGEADISEATWFGFPAIGRLRGLPAGIALVPLMGHTRGHVGVAVERGDGWLLHAGDAYTYHGQMAAKPRLPLGAALFQLSVDTHRGLRRENQRRLRALVRDHGDSVSVFSSHCAVEFARFSEQCADAS
ncbi:MBL fold metallo-hydrolase [Nocardia cyriacigeorgica]|nr:MBL fold metallo-hydrolase [Nocardia cyriacigeorgica]